MPKLKTNRGVSKRVRKTASGRLKRRHAFRSHIAITKSPKRKRQLRRSTVIAPSDQGKFRRLVPYYF